MMHAKAAHPMLKLIDSNWTLHQLSDEESIAVPARFSSEPREAPVSVHMRVHKLNQPIAEFAKRLMTRRGASPESQDLRSEWIGDHSMVTFDWTDGILNLETEVIDAGDGLGLEINYGFDPRIENGPSIDQVRNHLAEHVELSWPTQPAGSSTSSELSAQGDKRKQSLYFPEAVLEEIHREAERLDRSLSWVVQRAWKLAREKVRELPSATDGEQDAPAKRSNPAL
jgi:uncharacterized small protein (TIGR04563 family)